MWAQEGDGVPARLRASPTKSDSLSGTKRTKRSAARAEAGDDVAVLDPAAARVVPVVADTFEDDDGLLGEIVGPATPAPAGSLETASDELDLEDPDEDILGALAEPPIAAVDDLDDIFADMVPPSGTEQSGASRAISPPSPEPVEVLVEADSPGSTLPEAAVEGGPSHPEAGKSGVAVKRHRLGGRFLPRLAGTREISRKAYAGGLGLIVLLTIVSVGQAALILAGPASATGHGHGVPVPAAVAAPLPIDYATVDLERFIDKSRSLPEGGRQILRNPAVKEAIVELDSGEQLYQQIQSLASLSPTADLATIRNNRVRISSCNAADCGDKAFQLTYDIGRGSAVACVTEKYLNGAFVSYRYGPEGYEEVPHCSG
jgi:hypothetical protein